LVFVEVKYRKGNCSGTPEEAVDARKQHQICKVALFYLGSKRLGVDIPCRYDVVAVTEEEIRWYKNAFEHRW